MNKGTNAKKEIGVIVLLALIVGIMSIGFAAYSQTLNITGNLTVKKAIWSIVFKSGDANYSESTNSEAASSKTLDETEFEFTVTLEQPGDFYEGNITVINNGTMDGKLVGVELGGLSTAQKKYVDYSIFYNGTEYDSTTTGLSIALNAGNTAPVKVRADYLLPTDAEDLPSEDQTITLTGKLNFQTID